MLSTKQTIINFQIISQLKREWVSKPSSVSAVIYLRPTVTSRLKRPTRRVKPRAKLTGIFGLAGGGVCPADAVTDTAVRSCRTISPLPVPPCFLAKARTGAIGCVFSVALSLGSPRVAVNHHRALSCSDFPLPPFCFAKAKQRERPPDPLFSIDYMVIITKARFIFQ